MPKNIGNSPVFLWDNLTRQQLVREHRGPFPAIWEEDGKKFYRLQAIPNFYAHPADDEAILKMVSLHYQNQSFDVAGGPKSTVQPYEDSYAKILNQVDLKLFKTLNDFIYPRAPFITLKDNKMGFNEGFDGREYMHQYLEKYLKEPKRILEVGSGSGENLLHFKRLFPNADVVGVEPSQTGCELAQKMAAHFGLPITTICNTLEGAGKEWENNSFDIIFSSAVLSLRDVPHDSIITEILRLAGGSILTYDTFPEIWELGTPRTLASLIYQKTRRYADGILRKILHHLDQNKNFKLVDVLRTGHSHNPLMEPSFIRINRM